MLAEDWDTNSMDSRKSLHAGKDDKRQHRGKNQQQATNQKSPTLGIEINSELVWEDWNLHKEFTKTLVLKNIRSKLQRLHVRPPASTFFTASTPSTIFLSPGTSFSMPVTFKPLQITPYEDSIEFQGKDGSFQVRLCAIVPCHALEVPESVLLPLCAVEHSSNTTFLLRNVSKLQTFFQWECTAPFQLSPGKGLLRPSQECSIKVVFQPQEALVHQRYAYCWFGEENYRSKSCCTVLLQGVAKSPCLQLRIPGNKDVSQLCDLVLSFGSVAIGKGLQKHIEIFNPSPVTASFSLSLLSDWVPLSGLEFSCDVTSGEVASGGSVGATVTYSPIMADNASVQYLSLKCRGTLNETLLKLTGSCVGPKVSFSSSVVDFGCVEEGGAGVQTVELVNSSPAEAFYQWDLDCGHSVFSIQSVHGTIRPHSQTTLKAVFRPTQPIAHHRRVTCLILHKVPMFLDLIGICYSKSQKPVILKPEQLILYWRSWSTPADSECNASAMQQSHDDLDQEGEPCPQEEPHRADSAVAVQSPPQRKYYQSCTGGMDPLSLTSLMCPYVCVEPKELLFNLTTSSSLSTSWASSRSVAITNHTRQQLSLVWTAALDSPFSVFPSSFDLAPLKCTSFKVTYEPKQLNIMHAAQLECFAYYKGNYSDERVPCPPWCVNVRVIGHLFQEAKEHFLPPQCSLKPPQVVFPARSVLSYETALLQNCGDLPLTFCLDHSSGPTLAETVSIVPSCGLIPPRSKQILTLVTTPTEDSPKQGFPIRIKLNANEQTMELTVVSVVEKLHLSMEGDGSLHFQPTEVGSQTKRIHHIRNLSHLPLRYQWNIPEPDQELIFVEPNAGELYPNESSAHVWLFSPLEEKAYSLTPTLAFWATQTPVCNKSELTLNVEGMGSKGFIEAAKELLDVGEIVVGSCRSVEVPLVNRSPCSVHFCLSVRQILVDEDAASDPETLPKVLQLDFDRGIIASHSKMLLRATIKPHRRAKYLWTISYETMNASGCVLSPLQAVCEVQGQAIFPTLQVIDVCGSGSVGKPSKLHLWNLLSLDSLNEHLLASPSPIELTYTTTSKHSFRSCHSIFTETMLDFNFSAAPLYSEPSTFMLMFYNPGSIPVDWVFLFPEDQQIKLEFYTELSQMKVQASHLFSVSPRSGTLLPGQQRAVQFSYRHDFAGTDQLPVVFKHSHNREILLNFEGVTLEGGRSYLHCPSKLHIFASVYIGDSKPPRQVYELHNSGSVPVCYEVDLAVLSQLQVENFNHPLLRCLNPEGEVLPGKTVTLEWIFSPLEAKVYHMDIPIHIKDGDSMLVRIEGCGNSSPVLDFKNPFSCSDTKASKLHVQRRPFPEQVLFLSEDIISLGDIPVRSQFSRLFILINVSHTDTVLYKWNMDNTQLQEDVVRIHPEQGRLCPGDSALCVLTFTSTCYPTCCQMDVICQIIQEKELTQYNDELQRWEEERERHQYEFTITDKKSEKPVVLINKESDAAAEGKGPIIRKYKTLPPICSSGIPEEVKFLCHKRLEQRAKREAAKIWRRPEPPQPGLLHLGVIAHSHGFMEYFTHFPDQRNSLNRDLQPAKSVEHDANTPIHGPDTDLVMDVLTSLLWHVLDDPTIQECLTASTSKPVPNLSQSLHDPGPSHCPTPHPSSQHLSLLKGTLAGLKKQHNLVESKGTARHLDNVPKTQKMLLAAVPYDLSEGILLNTLQNLMVEAMREELILTAHPRTLYLQPVTRRGTSKVMAEQESKNNK